MHLYNIAYNKGVVSFTYHEIEWHILILFDSAGLPHRATAARILATAVQNSVGGMIGFESVVGNVYNARYWTATSSGHFHMIIMLDGQLGGRFCNENKMQRCKVIK